MKGKVTSLVAEESFPQCINCGNILVKKTVESCATLGIQSFTCCVCGVDHEVSLYEKYKRNNGKKMYQLSWNYSHV